MWSLCLCVLNGNACCYGYYLFICESVCVIDSRSVSGNWKCRWLSCGRIVSREFTMAKYIILQWRLFFFFLIPFRAYWALLPPSLALFSPMEWRAGGSDKVFCMNTDAFSSSIFFFLFFLFAPDTAQFWFRVTHTKTHESVLRRLQSQRKTDARVICSHLSLHPCIYIYLINNPLSLGSHLFSRMKDPGIPREGVLCRQVWYDQFFHFIPNFSRDRKLLGFIVIIKWPGNKNAHSRTMTVAAYSKTIVFSHSEDEVIFLYRVLHVCLSLCASYPSCSCSFAVSSATSISYSSEAYLSQSDGSGPSLSMSCSITCTAQTWGTDKDTLKTRLFLYKTQWIKNRSIKCQTSGSEEEALILLGTKNQSSIVLMLMREFLCWVNSHHFIIIKTKSFSRFHHPHCIYSRASIVIMW